MISSRLLLFVALSFFALGRTLTSRCIPFVPVLWAFGLGGGTLWCLRLRLTVRLALFLLFVLVKARDVLSGEQVNSMRCRLLLIIVGQRHGFLPAFVHLDNL